MFGEKHWNRGAIKCLDTLMEGMVDYRRLRDLHFEVICWNWNVISLSAHLPTAISAREKVFTPEFEPMPTGKQPAAVDRPVSQFR